MTSSPTSTNSNVISYDWVIHNFSNTTSQFTSTFPFPSNSGIQVNFWMTSNQTLTNFGGPFTIIAVYLVLSNRDKIKLKHRISIVNAKEVKCLTQEALGILKNSSPSGAPISILRADLLDSANGWLVNDTLTIHCEAELFDDDSFENGLPTKSGDFSSISQNYESLLESGKHSDVVLSIGDKEFHAHKLVLCARSPVFAAMFDHSDTKEAQQGRVDIKDVEVFQLFLRYLYTGQIEQLDRFAPELLTVADMYQMDCLKSLCEHYLCSTLTIDNVSQLLIHADLYRAEVLKCKCIDYVTDNSDKVQTTKGWKTVVVKADLLALLFAKLSMKHCK